MRLLLTTALIIWPSFAFAQIGNRTPKNDDLVTSSRLGKLAKKISDEKAPATNALPNQGQGGLQNTQTGNQLPSTVEQIRRITQGENIDEVIQASPPISNSVPSLSGMKVTSGAYDLSAGQDTSLDIAGVTIGMSPDQVKHTLTAKGYVLEETKMGPSFDELVKIKREHIPNNKIHPFKGAIAKLEFKNGVFETIKVRFLSMPGHPITQSVGYSNKDTSLTDNKIRHLLRDKYGDDHKSKRELAKSVLYSGPLGKQHYLDTQKYFEWFNRDHVDFDPKVRQRNRRIQSLNGALLGNSNGTRFTLSLSAEKDLKTLQTEQIRSRFGAATTTF